MVVFYHINTNTNTNTKQETHCTLYKIHFFDKFTTSALAVCTGEKEEEKTRNKTQLFDYRSFLYFVNKFLQCIAMANLFFSGGIYIKRRGSNIGLGK